MIPGAWWLVKAMEKGVDTVILCVIDGIKHTFFMNGWGCMSASLFGYISDRLSIVSVRTEPHIGNVAERASAQLRGIVPRHCSESVKNMVTWLTGSAKRHPGGFLTSYLRWKINPITKASLTCSSSPWLRFWQLDTTAWLDRTWSSSKYIDGSLLSVSLESKVRGLMDIVWPTRLDWDIYV